MNSISHKGEANKSDATAPLHFLGYNQNLAKYRIEHNLQTFDVGRVIVEHKDRYIVKTENGDFDAEIIGNLRYTAQSRTDFPAVGDWVAISEYDEHKVLIHAVFPRNTLIRRKAVGKDGEEQIIASNIDYAFIVQAVNRDFNLNRLERYLTICHDSRVQPIIVISKIDLISEPETQAILHTIHERMDDVPVIAISNENRNGLEELKKHIISGKTYCVLGSSGVGKSSLINNLTGQDVLKTDTIGEKTDRGKHVTSHRELIVLEQGGIIIDTPGMREVGLADMAEGLSLTFDQIAALAKSCKYKDCTHVHENGCAVKEAVEAGKIDQEMYSNYLKLEREQDHYTASKAERRKRDRKLGKMYKTIIQQKKKW